MSFSLVLFHGLPLGSIVKFKALFDGCINHEEEFNAFCIFSSIWFLDDA